MKVLIAYTSSYGSTREMAEKLASNFPDKAVALDLKNNSIDSLEPYQMVIIGSPVYSGKLSNTVLRFCERFQTALLSRKVGIFISCLSQRERAAEYLEQGFPAWLATHAFVREHVGGRVVLEKLNPFHRFLLKTVAHLGSDKNNLNPEALDRITQAVKAHLK